MHILSFSSGSVLLKKQQHFQSQQAHHHHAPSNLSQQHLKQQPQLNPLPLHYQQQEYSPVITRNHQVDSLSNGSTSLAAVVTTSEAVLSSTKSTNKGYPVDRAFDSAVAHPQVQNVLTQPSLQVKQMATHTIENVAADTSEIARHHVDIGTTSADGEIIGNAHRNVAGRIRS